MQHVPNDWWKAACEVVSQPMACVSTDHTYIWVNQAYEKLTGYSNAELTKMKWMDITVKEDVGADLASVQAIIDGTDESYMISKRYRHKHGDAIPISLSVWQFVEEYDATLVCFIVEAAPELIDRELSKVRQNFAKAIKNLETRVKQMDEKSKDSGGVTVSVGNSGQGITTNSTKAIYFICFVMIVLLVVVAYVAYYLSGGDQPPVMPVP